MGHLENSGASGAKNVNAVFFVVCVGPVRI
jgi:hypothetical protein